MPVQILNTGPAPFPFAYTKPTISVKANWGDPWTVANDLELKRFNVCVAAHGTPTCEFVSRYGRVKQPYETAFTTRPELDIRQWWAQVTIPKEDVNPVDPQIAFCGYIYSDARHVEVANFGGVDVKTGEQHWEAMGPRRILEMIEISTAFFLDGNDEKEVQYLPEMNSHGPQRIIVGNRSTIRGKGGVGAFLYGGNEQWDARQYLEYVLERYVQQYDESGNRIGPEWGMSGLLSVLEELPYVLKFSEVTTAAEVLKKLIPRELGLDYQILYTERGFDVNVFSLIGENSTFQGVTLPKNENIVRVRRAGQLDLSEVKIVRNRENMYDSLRVIGQRAVLCATLSGANAPIGGNELVPGWSHETFERYILGAGPGADAVDHDNARASDKFRDVFQCFRVPKDWNHGTDPAGVIVGLSPKITLQGTIGDEPAPFQNNHISTLSWLPLFVDFDYTNDPALDQREDPDIQPRLQRPAAYIWNEGKDGQGGPAREAWIELDKVGMSISVPNSALGVLVSAGPNHKLALNHAFREGSPEEITTDVTNLPMYDYSKLVCTLAWHLDQRVQVGFDVPENLKVGDGSCKKIYVGDAEIWILAPQTVLTVGADGEFILSGDDFQIVRDDTPRLKLMAAGEIARYLSERVRADVTIKGARPWADLVGAVLEVIEEAGQSNFVGSVITNMEFGLGESPQMQFGAGYAGA